jgi:hypothetical protein
MKAVGPNVMTAARRPRRRVGGVLKAGQRQRWLRCASEHLGIAGYFRLSIFELVKEEIETQRCQEVISCETPSF